MAGIAERLASGALQATNRHSLQGSESGGNDVECGTDDGVISTSGAEDLVKDVDGGMPKPPRSSHAREPQSRGRSSQGCSQGRPWIERQREG